MLFNSLQYAIFLPIVFALYWGVPHAKRWFVVLVSSYFFYMCWNPKYILLFLLVTLASYTGAILIDRAERTHTKKLVVYVVAFICFGILFIFKYFNFISETIRNVMHYFNNDITPMRVQFLLPVGISFYIFQAIGYLVDVYRKDVDVEYHFGKYAAFISFFPQLVAGPIERSHNLLRQLNHEKSFQYEQATYGLKLMAWGYFKKIAIADTLAVYVDKVFADLHFFSGGARLVAMFFFTIQIYCDFSGYSDIARGTAKLFGIELMINFKSPYFAASIKEFWKRWHISLSTWFRDYVYIPLGGNRVSTGRNSLNLLITFLISGVWHGASWTYIAWGGLHGTLQIIEKEKNALVGRKKIIKLPRWIRIAITFFSVSVLWTFFRAKTISEAVYTLVYLFNDFENPLQYMVSAYHNLGLNKEIAIRICIMLLLLIIYDWISLKKDVIQQISRLELIPRWSIYICFLILIFVFTPSTSAEFIYFDF